MEPAILVTQILTLLIVTIGGLFLKNYLPSYFSEKGKNLATREDIAAITEEIERIRSQHTADIERLRASLTYSTGEQTRLREHQKEALLKFYEECRSAAKIAARITPITSHDPEALLNDRRTLGDASSQVLDTSLRLGLYLPLNNNLHAAAIRLASQITLLTLLIDQHLGSIIKAAKEPEQAEADQPSTPSTIDEFNRKIESHFDKLDDLLIAFIGEFNEYITTYEN